MRTYGSFCLSAQSEAQIQTIWKVLRCLHCVLKEFIHVVYESVFKEKRLAGLFGWSSRHRKPTQICNEKRTYLGFTLVIPPLILFFHFLFFLRHVERDHAEKVNEFSGKAPHDPRAPRGAAWYPPRASTHRWADDNTVLVTRLCYWLQHLAVIHSGGFRVFGLSMFCRNELSSSSERSCCAELLPLRDSEWVFQFEFSRQRQHLISLEQEKIYFISAKRWWSSSNLSRSQSNIRRLQLRTRRYQNNICFLSFIGSAFQTSREVRESNLMIRGFIIGLLFCKIILWMQTERSASSCYMWIQTENIRPVSHVGPLCSPTLHVPRLKPSSEPSR